MTTPVGLLETIPEKLKWLDERYWKLGQDANFAVYLADLYEVDEDGKMTSVPRKDPLNGETNGLMVLGGSGSGKSAMAVRALRTSKVLVDYATNKNGNTLFIEIPPDATIKSLAGSIAKSTGYSGFDYRLKTYEAWDIARHRLKLSGITTLIIDECHHLFRIGPGRDVLGAIQALKHMLQSDHAVALIIIGVPQLRDALFIEKTRETYRRFEECHMPAIQTGSTAALTFGLCLRSCADALGVVINDQDFLAERILFAEHGEAGKSVKLAKKILRDAIVKRHDSASLASAARAYKNPSSQSGMTPFHAGEWKNVKKELLATGWMA